MFLPSANHLSYYFSISNSSIRTHGWSDRALRDQCRQVRPCPVARPGSSPPEIMNIIRNFRQGGMYSVFIWGIRAVFVASAG